MLTDWWVVDRHPNRGRLCSSLITYTVFSPCSQNHRASLLNYPIACLSALSNSLFISLGLKVSNDLIAHACFDCARRGASSSSSSSSSAQAAAASSKYYIEQTHMRAVRTASIKRALLMSCWYHVNERRPLGALTPTHTHTLKRWACNYVIDRGARFERVYGF